MTQARRDYNEAVGEVEALYSILTGHLSVRLTTEQRKAYDKRYDAARKRQREARGRIRALAGALDE